MALGTLIKHLFLPPSTWLNMETPFIPTGLLENDSLYCGVELELENCKFKLPSSGGTSEVGDLVLKHAIKAHHDGSLRNGGIELVTKPCRGLSLVEQVHYICDTANARDWQPSNRAGLHVHINVQNLTPEQVTNLIKLYILVEPCFFKATGTERKGSIYCKGWYQSIDSAQLAHTMKSLVNGNWDALPSRYFGFNINSLAKYGTVEFRHKNSTTSADEILKWINTIGKWYNYALAHDITETLVKGLTPDGLVQEVFGSMELMDQEYPSYFYHGCVPLWFDIFGPETTPIRSWERRKLKAHKGYSTFVAGRPPPSPTPQLRRGAPLAYSPAIAHLEAAWQNDQLTPIPIPQEQAAAPTMVGVAYWNNNIDREVYFVIPPPNHLRVKMPGQMSTKVDGDRVWRWAGGVLTDRADLFYARANSSEQALSSSPLLYVYSYAN